jgi:UDP-glucose 4-epimerase
VLVTSDPVRVLISSMRVLSPATCDNLSNGHADFVKWGPLETGDIRDRRKLDDVIRKYRPAAIVHFAAAIEIGESVQNPAGFYDNNVSGTISLLLAAQAAGVDKIVFPFPCRWVRAILSCQLIHTVGAS